jgi:hypothetical protein
LNSKHNKSTADISPAKIVHSNTKSFNKTSFVIKPAIDMKASFSFVLVIASMASAASVTINATTSNTLNGKPTFQTIPNVELNSLAFSSLEITALQIEPGSGNGVDAHAVECRRYKDHDGLVPGSTPFDDTTKAIISTNKVAFGSVLCYVTER